MLSGMLLRSEKTNTLRNELSEYWYMELIDDISASTKKRMAPLFAAGRYPLRVFSISSAVFAPSLSFSATSIAFDLVSSRVSISSTLSSMLPVDCASSRSNESSSSLSSFLLSLETWQRCKGGQGDRGGGGQGESGREEQADRGT